MLVAGIIVFCVLLLVLAFLLPRLSRHPERAGRGAMNLGARGASQAPGRLGYWLQKPFSKAGRAITKSGSAGRRGRGKLPL